jgi:hypothetical protein
MINALRDPLGKTRYHMSVEGWPAGHLAGRPRCGRALAEVLERHVDDYPSPSGQRHSRDIAGSPARDACAPVFLLLIGSD